MRKGNPEFQKLTDKIGNFREVPKNKETTAEAIKKNIWSKSNRNHFL